MSRAEPAPPALSSERLLLLLVTAVVLAAFDQWVKLTLPAPDWALHHRSETWFLGSLLLLAAMMLLARIPSKAVAVAAGIFSGGVLGNLLSASSNSLYVPNPLMFGHRYAGVAFNVADAFILTGNLMLMASLVVIVIRHRERLPKRQAIWNTLRPRG